MEKSKDNTMTTKSDQELAALIADARETMRVERFKDKWSRKANIISSAKRAIARAETERSARRLKGVQT
jgi:ribosomal protein L29